MNNTIIVTLSIVIVIAILSIVAVVWILARRITSYIKNENIQQNTKSSGSSNIRNPPTGPDDSLHIFRDEDTTKDKFTGTNGNGT